MSTKSDERLPLSQVLPPLILGTATFNKQYHPDPQHMPYAQIVNRALKCNVTGFDTSPYYGPSEILLGEALRQLKPQPPPRESYFLITKAGRIAGNEFDYSPAWVRYSVCRSLDRLGTTYLDLVYMHDVEFVSPKEVVTAIKELRKLRDRGLVRYVGISGYPVETLASLAELVLRKTGEPLDAVMSYNHYCVQNTSLGDAKLLQRFKDAGVECLPNASMLGMGLLTTRGVDNAPMAAWHPAPPALREACKGLSKVAEKHGKTLENVAIRWALRNWAHTGAAFGSSAGFNTETTEDGQIKRSETNLPKVGVSVMGVSSLAEFQETWHPWTSVLQSIKDGVPDPRQEKLDAIVREEMWPSLGDWKNYSWQSGGEGFVNPREVKGVVPDDETSRKWGLLSKRVDLSKI